MPIRGPTLGTSITARSAEKEGLWVWVGSSRAAWSTRCRCHQQSCYQQPCQHALTATNVGHGALVAVLESGGQAGQLVHVAVGQAQGLCQVLALLARHLNRS